MTKNEKAASDKSAKKKVPDVKSPLTSTPKPAGTKKTPNWSSRLLVILLIFIAGALTALYFMPALKERLPIVAGWIGDNQSTDIAAINQQISAQQAEIETLKQRSSALEANLNQVSTLPTDELEARIASLEASLDVEPDTAVPEPVIATDTSQSARIDMLLSRMSQLEAAFVPLSKNMIDGGRAESVREALIAQSVSMSAKLANLESRLQSVERVAAKDNSAILLNLKIAELKRALASGSAYSEQLNTVNEMIEASPALATNSRISEAVVYLSETADAGILTADQLRHDFNALIPDILNAEGLDADASWWQNTLNSLKNMVTVRKTDGTSLNDAGLDSLIAQLERWLQSDRFGPAIDVVAQMPDAIKTLLADWTSAAQRWLQSGQAINELESIAAESYLTVSSAPVPETDL